MQFALPILILSTFTTNSHQISHSELVLLKQARLHYVHLQAGKDSGTPWIPSAKLVEAARHASKIGGVPKVDIPAAYFVLALSNIEPDSNVKAMVKAAVAAPAGSSDNTDVIETLPYALELVYRKTSSPAALSAVCSLRLDGGPADILDEVRGDVFVDYPKAVAKVWQGLGSTKRIALEQSIALELDKETVVRFHRNSTGSLRKFASGILTMASND